MARREHHHGVTPAHVLHHRYAQVPGHRRAHRSHARVPGRQDRVPGRRLGAAEPARGRCAIARAADGAIARAADGARGAATA
jgi:hypothetical protein